MRRDGAGLKGRAGLFGAATGVLAAGVGLGLAAERVAVGRHAGRREAAEPIGSWRGTPRIVTTDDGLELYVEVDEPGEPGGSDEPPLTVVFCHGYALNLDCWHFQRMALCRRPAARPVRLVSYDQRSHGRSGRAPADSCTIDRLGMDLATVVREVCPSGPMILVGHSMGGMTIMALAGQQPELFGDRVRGVALIATSAGGLDAVTLGAPAPIGQVVNRVAPAFVAALSRVPELAEHGRTPGSDVGYLLTRHYSFGSRVPPERVAFVEAMLAGTPIEVVAEFFPGFAVHEKYAALEVLRRVETLVLGGGKDLITPVEHAREISRRLPAAEYIELPTCGHMIPIEHPGLVDACLFALLDRVSAALHAEEREGGPA